MQTSQREKDEWIISMILAYGPPWKSSMISVLHYLSFPSAASSTMSVPERDNQIKPHRAPVEFAAPGTERPRENPTEPTVPSEGGGMGPPVSSTELQALFDHRSHSVTAVIKSSGGSSH